MAVSSLLADRFCGNETELIYYLSPGEILSRTFTFKDTHSPKGDLLVVYAEVPRVGEENAGQSRATTAILGFHSPSFTYGTDLILPAGINADLRQLLLSGANASGKEEATEEDDERAMQLVAAVQGVSVPEVSRGFLEFVLQSPRVWTMQATAFGFFCSNTWGNTRGGNEVSIVSSMTAAGSDLPAARSSCLRQAHPV